MQKLLSITINIFHLLVLMTGLTSASANTTSQLVFSDAEKSWIQQHSEIRVSFDSHFPPYSFLNDNGELEGFSVDVIKLIGQRTGLTFHTSSAQEWNEIYTAAKQKQTDVVATMVDMPKRHEWFNFSQPYLFKSLVIVTQNDNQAIERRDDIANKTVALVKGYQYISKLLTEFPSIKPLYVDTMLDALNAVSVGDADAALSFLGGAHYYRNKYLLPNLKYAAVYDANSSNESIAIRKDWPELHRILSKALNSISAAEMHQLRAKWFPTEYLENLIEIEFTENELNWLKQKQKIRLGIDPEFAPFEFIEDGVYKGIASDYVKLLKQRLNIDIEIVKGLSWKQVIEKAKLGEIDALAAIAITNERQQFLNYTPAYIKFHRVIVTRDDMPFISELDDISDLKIAVQQSSSHHGFINEQSNITPILYPSLQQSLMAVSGGEVDAFIGNVAASTYWIRQLNLTNLKIAAPISNEVQTLHFAVRKDWPELVSILEKGLSTISSAQQKKISEKWLSVGNKPEIDYLVTWRIILITSLFLIVILIWNRALKRQVKHRTSQLEFAAHYDKLTALPNRFLIIDRLKQFIAEANHQDQKIALFSIDINEFKKINDAFGHESGDIIIRQVSERISNTLGKQDSVGRLGGDQFLVIHKCFNDHTDIALTAESLLSKLSEGYQLESKEISLSISIGIAIYPDDANNGETLLRHADSATHYVKEQLHGGFDFYTDGLTQRIARKLELERYMRGALARNELEVHYQPKIDAKTRRIVSFEALLRWHNPELGNVSPIEFIPLAEKSDLIIPFGEFVLRQSLKTLASWQQHYQQDFSMAINLSPVQFKSQKLIPLIEEITQHYGLQYKNVEFEITEGVLLAEHIDIEDKLKLLETLGVTLTMDDFGTGYSSMNYLRKYKFDALKIDRAFINELNADNSSHKLVSATIAMAHGLDMKVVAEGVETEQQYTTLVEQDCDLVQGWLFSQALPADKVELLLNGSSFIPQ